MPSFIFQAPTGVYLQGTFERMDSTCGVEWHNPDDADEFDYGTTYKDFGDGAVTVTLAGQTVFLCGNGDEWLARHLIPEAAEPYPPEVIAAMHREYLAAEQFDMLTNVLASMKSDFAVTEHAGNPDISLPDEIADMEGKVAYFRDRLDGAQALTKVRIEEYERGCWLASIEYGVPGPDGGTDSCSLTVPADSPQQASFRAHKLMKWRHGDSVRLFSTRVVAPAAKGGAA